MKNQFPENSHRTQIKFSKKDDRENFMGKDDLIVFNVEPDEPAHETEPELPWVAELRTTVSELLKLQPTITVHRSKLFSLFDDLRALMKDFKPNPTEGTDLSAMCRNFIDAMNKARQVVYYCSATHWSQPAISWSSGTMRDSIKRIREDVAEVLAAFNITPPTPFVLPDDQYAAENKVDLLQLKGSLMEYHNHLENQPQTPQIQQVMSLITDRLRSIGPIEGLQDGPPLVCVPPFLPSKLNLVMTHDQFEIGQVIGSGTFGSVHIGQLTGTFKKVAIKVLNTKVLGGRQLETFKREVWTMATLNHPNILRLIGVTLTPPFCIITELLKCSLFDRLKLLSATKRSLIALKVSQAMENLHAARIIHRDLKSANILLDDEDMPRVCDFGLVGFKTGATRTGFVGTAQWMAPEILRSSPFYDEKVDVYSFGVMLWEMLTLKEPYAGMSQDQMVMAIIEDGLRPSVVGCGPPRVVELIQRCWAEVPSDRPTFAQVSQALAQPEFHFIGTDEEEFSKMAPKDRLSQSLVNAYDANNVTQMLEYLREVTRESTDHDSELMPVIMTLFPSLTADIQAGFIRHLPAIVDFEQFLARRGYTFIVSLLSSDNPSVVSATVECLRGIDLHAKAFRQVALISKLSHSTNVDAIALCADLCEYEDIAEHVIRNCLPFNLPDTVSLYLLYVYHSLLLHKNFRAKVSLMKEPLEICAKTIKAHPFVSCMVLEKFIFSELHSDIVVDLDLINLVALQSNANPRSLKVLKNIFTIVKSESLGPYAKLIGEVVRRHRRYFDDDHLIRKLSQISGCEIKSGPSDALIKF